MSRLSAAGSANVFAMTEKGNVITSASAQSLANDCGELVTS